MRYEESFARYDSLSWTLPNQTKQSPGLDLIQVRWSKQDFLGMSVETFIVVDTDLHIHTSAGIEKIRGGMRRESFLLHCNFLPISGARTISTIFTVKVYSKVENPKLSRFWKLLDRNERYASHPKLLAADWSIDGRNWMQGIYTWSELRKAIAISVADR